MHTKNSANPPEIRPAEEQVLVALPNGQCAWLRPAGPVDRYRLTERVVIVDQPEDLRYVLTTKGRRAIAS
jgi:hypothetical protein